MDSDRKRIGLDVPVVRNRRELYEQESAIAGLDPNQTPDLSGEEVPDDVEAQLRSMRQNAAHRTDRRRADQE